MSLGVFIDNYGAMPECSQYAGRCGVSSNVGCHMAPVEVAPDVGSVRSVFLISPNTSRGYVEVRPGVLGSKLYVKAAQPTFLSQLLCAMALQVTLERLSSDIKAKWP